MPDLKSFDSRQRDSSDHGSNYKASSVMSSIPSHQNYLEHLKNKNKHFGKVPEYIMKFRKEKEFRQESEKHLRIIMDHIPIGKRVVG